MNEPLPADLGSAIAASAEWLQIWVALLAVSNLGAILFVLKRQEGKITVRIEAILIVLSFVLAGVMMTWMYGEVGYVRLLGLPHLIFWLPVYIWLLMKYRRGDFQGLFKYYLIFYFVIAGISLVTDFSDVSRYLLGEQQSLHSAN